MESYQYPEELKYSEEHTWVLADDDISILVVGITAYNLANLGDIVAVDLPRPGGMVDIGDEICTIEGDRMVIEVCAPLAGELVEVNTDLIDAPGLVNSDPYGDGWLYKLKIKDKVEYNRLLTAEEYKDFLVEED